MSEKSLTDVPTKQLIEEIANRTSDLLVVFVEDKAPKFASCGSSFVIAGLLQAAVLLNDRHVLNDLTVSDTTPHLKLASNLPPDPPTKPGA